MKRKNYIDSCIKEFYLSTALEDFESSIACFKYSKNLKESELELLENVDWNGISEKFELIAMKRLSKNKLQLKSSKIKERKDFRKININNDKKVA